MTLGKLIEKIIRNRGQDFDTEDMVGWVNEIEGQAVEMVINRAEGVNVEFVPYQYYLDAEKQLQIPDRFQDVYISYLYSKIDFNHQETERYNNDVAMFEAAWQEYSAWYIRTRKPKALPGFRNL